MKVIAKNITKKYDDFFALNNISFELPENKIIGLIGHNGSGKTTILEIMAGLKKSDMGSLSYTQNRKFKADLGVVLQDNEFYSDAKVGELLSLFASFYPQNVDILQLEKKTKIDKFRNEFYRNLSGGMKQRVNIAIALVNNPSFLILDEPTTGLDPLARRDLWKLINSVTEKTTTVISSHYMDEVEKNCDYLIMLKNGSIVLKGYTKDIVNSNSMSLDELYIQINESEEESK
ncbi:ABC transporter ATP-binding protein [Lactobacillus sp. DCY120]|uniref:ABC transporter ATP-binding protein n=1 Tax=Bombilactobacillus apium TaxID=2675299 RepID=A0A850QWK6_9LACO|nr:ABC transporter ATP-binding protein [Bombilactobacillus apium]NVY96184.1 ABC transporter ATP-binding protein [Bombilactobacillus apium]